MICFITAYVVLWLAVLFTYGPLAALALTGATVVVGLLLLVAAVWRLTPDPEEFPVPPELARRLRERRP